MGFPRQEYWNGLPVFFSRGSSGPRNWTCVSSIEGRFFTAEPLRKPQQCDCYLTFMDEETEEQRNRYCVQDYTVNGARFRHGNLYWFYTLQPRISNYLLFKPFKSSRLQGRIYDTYLCSVTLTIHNFFLLSNLNPPCFRLSPLVLSLVHTIF